MTDFLWNLVALNTLIIVLFLVFKLVQRQLTFSQQRFSILALPILALLVLLIKEWLIVPSWSYTIPVIEIQSTEVTTKVVSNEFTWFSLQNAYLIGLVFFSGWLMVRLVRIYWLFQRSTKQLEDGFRVVELPNHDSFSFFRWIQLREGLEDQDRSIVLQHEKIHAQKGHSVDQIYLEVIQCVAWFNPIIPLIKKELTQVHEFEVDQLMYNKYRVSYMEFLLSYSLGTSSSSYLLTNQFMGKLTLIKRIKIMKNTTKKRWVFALVLPLLAATLTLVSWSYVKSTTPKSSTKAMDKSATKVDKLPISKDDSKSKVTSSESAKEIQFMEPINTTTSEKYAPKMMDVSTEKEVYSKVHDDEVDMEESKYSIRRMTDTTLIQK